jgi:hypothetical protein
MTGLSGLGTVGGDGCFTTNFANVTSLDSLNWGAPISTSGESGLGSAVPPNNQYILSNPNDPVVDRTATANNYQVQVQLPTAYVGTLANYLTRMDDFAMIWSGSSWVAPGNSSPDSFAGHFNSASPSAQTPDGDPLVALPSGGPLELSFLNAPGPMSGIWFQIAALSGDANTYFTASVQAFDVYGNPLGTYTLSEGPPGAGTGGQCTSLSSVPPAPCNDAPYVGFYDPEGRINSIYISVIGNNSLGVSTGVPVGFAIDSLYMDETDEAPAVPLMIAGGLAAMALYRRKRLARVG